MTLGDDIAITSKENFKKRTLKGRLKHITTLKSLFKMANKNLCQVGTGKIVVRTTWEVLNVMNRFTKYRT